MNVVNLGKSLIMKCESCYPIYFTDVSSLVSVANKVAFSLFIVEVFRRFVYPCEFVMMLFNYWCQFLPDSSCRTQLEDNPDYDQRAFEI